MTEPGSSTPAARTAAGRWNGWPGLVRGRYGAAMSLRLKPVMEKGLREQSARTGNDQTAIAVLCGVGERFDAPLADLLQGTSPHNKPQTTHHGLTTSWNRLIRRGVLPCYALITRVLAVNP